MREDYRVYGDPTIFHASPCDSVLLNAAPVQIDVGELERPALELLEAVGHRRTATLSGPVASSAVAEATRSSGGEHENHYGACRA